MYIYIYYGYIKQCSANVYIYYIVIKTRVVLEDRNACGWFYI